MTDKAIVIGGGLLGVASAWELASRGKEVELVEACEDVAMETSYANGAMLTPSMPDPWNGPGVFKHLAASLFNPYSPMKLRLRAVPSLTFWGLKFLRNSNVKRHEQATRANYQLASYSVLETESLRQELGLEYEASTIGTMKLFDSKEAMTGPRHIADSLADLGLCYEELDADGAIAEEPQLHAIRDRIAGAFRFRNDTAGDAKLFCDTLTEKVKERGGKIRTGTAIQKILTEGGRVSGVQSQEGQIEADTVVLAAGCSSAKIGKSVGLSLPIKPAKGYSVTVARGSIEDWPRLAVIDDAMHAGVVPLGNRLRLVGTAEFTGNDKRIRQARIDNLFSMLKVLYPHIAEQIDTRQGETWAGLRPMTDDGLPYIGAAGPEGLYLNAGHGHLGWTMAVGSAKLLVDQMLGRPPAIDPTPYAYGR